MERFDVYDSSGHVVGTLPRGSEVPENHYRMIVSVFVVNSKRQLLMTKRDENKTFPLQWEVTAGLVQAGESPLSAACRELREETGILCNPSDLLFLDNILHDRMRFRTVSYLLKRDVSLDSVVLQPGETVDVRWTPITTDIFDDDGIAEPVRRRLAMYWRELLSLFDPSGRTKPWIEWAKELQSLSQQGLQYTKDPYDAVRFQQISDIACDMISHKTGISVEKVTGLFANEVGYQTPKVETRAAVFDSQWRILLVQERASGLWSMPGGWCDIGLGIGENTVKECWEEAGMHVKVDRLIAIENRSKHDYTEYPYEILKCYVLCELDGGSFEENIETIDARFFSLDALPPLSMDRVNERSIRMCLEAAKNRQLPVYFD